MIDFYALTSPNVQKIYIMLEETGLPYEIVRVDLASGENLQPDFLESSGLNPARRHLPGQQVTRLTYSAASRRSNRVRTAGSVRSRSIA